MDITPGLGNVNLLGQPTYAAGNTFSGPLIAGSIKNSSGPGTLPAGAGGLQGLANAGYAEMGQSANIAQAAGAVGTPIVIPGQSQILSITLMVTAAWTGAATTVSIGRTGGGAADLVALTAAAALGQLTLLPGTVAAAIALWNDVGNPDLQITVSSANAGSGAGVLTVRYLQAINVTAG